MHGSAEALSSRVLGAFGNFSWSSFHWKGTLSKDSKSANCNYYQECRFYHQLGGGRKVTFVEQILSTIGKLGNFSELVRKIRQLLCSRLGILGNGNFGILGNFSQLVGKIGHFSHCGHFLSSWFGNLGILGNFSPAGWEIWTKWTISLQLVLLFQLLRWEPGSLVPHCSVDPDTHTIIFVQIIEIQNIHTVITTSSCGS